MKSTRTPEEMKLEIYSFDDVRKHIHNCEGKHAQQAIYSTFHDALTQVCFGCKKVRSTIKR